MQKSLWMPLVVGLLSSLGGACSSDSVMQGPPPQYVPVPMGVANGYWVAVDENGNGVYDEGDQDIEASVPLYLDEYVGDYYGATYTDGYISFYYSTWDPWWSPWWDPYWRPGYGWYGPWPWWYWHLHCDDHHHHDDDDHGSGNSGGGSSGGGNGGGPPSPFIADAFTIDGDGAGGFIDDGSGSFGGGTGGFEGGSTDNGNFGGYVDGEEEDDAPIIVVFGDSGSSATPLDSDSPDGGAVGGVPAPGGGLGGRTFNTYHPTASARLGNAETGFGLNGTAQKNPSPPRPSDKNSSRWSSGSGNGGGGNGGIEPNPRNQYGNSASLRANRGSSSSRSIGRQPGAVLPPRPSGSASNRLGSGTTGYGLNGTSQKNPAPPRPGVRNSSRWNSSQNGSQPQPRSQPRVQPRPQPRSQPSRTQSRPSTPKPSSTRPKANTSRPKPSSSRPSQSRPKSSARPSSSGAGKRRPRG